MNPRQILTLYRLAYRADRGGLIATLLAGALMLCAALLLEIAR